MTRLCTFGFDDPSEFLLGTPQDEGLASGQKVTGLGFIRRLPTNLVGVGNMGMLIIGGNATVWQYNLGANITDLYFAGSFYAQALTNAQQIVAFDTRTDLAWSSTLNIIWNTDGSLSLRRGTTVLASSSAGLVATNTKYCLECYVKPRDSGGEFTVKLDGTQIATYAGDTTDSAGSSDSFRIYSCNTGTTQWTFWDDVIANSNAGSTNNTWIGRVFLWPLHAIGAGNSQQLDRGGIDMGSNFAQIRDPDPGGAHYLQGDLNDIDLFTVDCPDIPAGATINNIIVQGVGKSTGGAGLIALLCRCGGTTSTGSDQTLTASPMIRQEVFAVCPDDSAAWAEADLANGLEIGVKIRS